MFTELLTRKVIGVILDQGLKFGLDVAGAFLGPAWPVVRPIVEKLLDGLPKDIAGRYKSSREAIAEAKEALELQQAEIAIITKALNESGLSSEWTEAVLNHLKEVSDDVRRMVFEQAQHGKSLDEIKAQLEALSAEQGALLVFRAERLEYVDYLNVPGTFLPGYDLAAGTFITEKFPGRHAPAGFFCSS